MVTAVVDTSGLYALLDGDDLHHAAAVGIWDALSEVDLVAHAYVVTESLALTRARLGWSATVALIDLVLPAIRVEMVERDVHDAALSEHRTFAGGTSFVDRVTIAFARQNDITGCFGFDRDLEAAGLKRLS